MITDFGRSPDGSGSRPTDRAASTGVSPVPASIPNAATEWTRPKDAFTQVVWWFPEWCGLGFFRWGGASNCLFRWSIVLGFVEWRRWRSKDESARLFAELSRQYIEEDKIEAFAQAAQRGEGRTAIATEARRAETPESGSVHEGAGPKDIAHD